MSDPLPEPARPISPQALPPPESSLRPAGSTTPRTNAWRNPFFSLCAALSLGFVVTVFALVATMFGDPQSPMNKFLDEQGLTLIAVEVAGILISGVAAMMLDQWWSRGEPAVRSKD